MPAIPVFIVIVGSVGSIFPPNYINQFGGWDESEDTKVIARLSTLTTRVQDVD
jgi:hypothetical protein